MCVEVEDESGGKGTVITVKTFDCGPSQHTTVRPQCLLDTIFLFFLGGHATGRNWVIRIVVPIIFFLPYSCVSLFSFFLLSSLLFIYLFSLFF